MRIAVLTLSAIFLISSVLSAQAEDAPAKKQKKSSLFSALLKAVMPVPVSDAPAVRTIESDAPATIRGKQEQNIDENATHEQVKLIKTVNGENQLLPLNTFCLTNKDEILAGCGNGPGEIRVYSADGDFVRSWEVPVKPEAINTTADGDVLVAGDGKLFKFTDSGQLVLRSDAPHAANLRENADELRKQVEQQNEQRAEMYTRQINVYQQQIDRLTKKQQAADEDEANPEFTKSDQRRLTSYERNIKVYEKQRDRYAGQKLTKAQIEAQVQAMTRSKMAVSSISSDGKQIYVATRAMQGYGFAIWKVDNQFENPEKIVSGLRGCCGQMDVQACKNGIYVAENSRHRVVCFSDSGEKLLDWGKRDRKGVDGFSSCCNPMNVNFGPNGDVYTAESNTGRIKRFSAKGEFRDYVGDVKLVPGCKKVSIAVSQDGERVYMLDITRNHIVLMKKKSESIQQVDKTDVESTKTTG